MPNRPSTSAADADEYETETVIVELNGVLDAEAVRNAVNGANVAVRKAASSKPLVQVGSTLYTAEWRQTVGTDLIFYRANPSQPVELVAASDTRLVAQKALITTTQTAEQASEGVATASTSTPLPPTSFAAKGSPQKKKPTKSPTKGH